MAVRAKATEKQNLFHRIVSVVDDQQSKDSGHFHTYTAVLVIIDCLCISIQSQTTERKCNEAKSYNEA